MKTLVTLAAILLFTITGWAQGPVRRADTLQQVLAIDPTKVAVGKLSYLVMGRTNVTDGELLLVDFDPTNSLAADNISIFTNVIDSGRWVIRPILGSSSLTFQAGTNMSVVVTNNTVTYSYSGTPSLLIDGLPVTEFLDNGYVNFDNGGSGTQFSLYLGDDTVSTNKINSTFYNWVLSLAGAGGGTTNGLGVNGTFRTDWNAINSAEIAYTLSAGTNWYASIIAGSITTNKIDTTFRNWVLSMASGSSGESNTASNLGTPSSSVIGLYDSKSGVDLRFKSVEAGSNVAITNTGNTVRISAILSTNSGTTVTVDGGSGLSTANFDDGGDINFANSGANVTGTVKADAVALGTDTTGNYVATVTGTENEVTVSGSGSETAAVTVSLPATVDLGGKTSFEVPNAAAPTVDAFGEIAGDNDAWASGRGALLFYDGTAATRVVGVLASDTPSNGQVPKWNTGGTITWEDDNTGSGSGTVVTANGGSDMTRANLVGGNGLSIVQSGTNLTFTATNNYTTDHYAGGFLPLFAGVSNALTGDLSMNQGSDVRLFMSETSRMLTDGYEVMGLRAYNGKLALHSFATNDLSAAEEFMVIDPSDLTGPTDIITFPNSGFNNKVVFDADVEFNGTVTGGGLTSSDTNWNGNPIVTGTITNLTTEKINSLSYYSVENGDAFSDGDNFGTYTEIFYPNWYGIAIAGGSPGSQSATTNNPSTLQLNASASANSGYAYMSGTTAEDLGSGGKQFFAIVAFPVTNLVAARIGFQDSSSDAEPTDGAYVRMANGYVYGVLRNNSTETVTTTSNRMTASSTAFYRVGTTVNTDQASVRFWLLTATSPGVFTTNWTASVTNTLPTGTSRLTGHGVEFHHTSGSAGTTIGIVDALSKRNTRLLTR